MRFPPASSCVPIAAALAVLVPASAALARGAQVDPNDPNEARTRYEAPRTREQRLDVPGLPEATRRERAGLGLLSVIDQYQADLSRVALDRGLDPQVQAWAESVLGRHAANKGRHDAWLPDTGHARAQDWMRRSQRDIAALRAAAPAAVSSAYLQAITQSLAEASTLLDRELIPESTTPAVRAHLRDLQRPLAAELAVGRRLQARGDTSAGALP